MKRFALIVVALMATAGFVRADEIDFVEDFVLAKDREAALQQLIPGTEDYYYYHCLYHQNEKRFDKVDEILSAWVKRFKRSACRASRPASPGSRSGGGSSAGS